MIEFLPAQNNRRTTKSPLKRGGYKLTAPAYGSRVASFGYFNTEKAAINWILENGISEKLTTFYTPEAAERAARLRGQFLEAVENSGLSWIAEQNPAFFEDFVKAPKITTETEKEITTETAEKENTTAETNNDSTTKAASHTDADSTTKAAISDSDSTPTSTDSRTAGEAARIATAARTARQTAYNPNRPHKTSRGYISTIDSTKARHGAKYAPTMARPTPPHSIGLQKMGFHSIKKGNIDQSDKILHRSVKNCFGFCIGLSPPWGVSKNFTLNLQQKILGGYKMKSIKRKSQTNILDSHGNKLYFVGIDAFMTSGGSPCVILATDINDQKTFSRYTMDFMEICGYAI